MKESGYDFSYIEIMLLFLCFSVAGQQCDCSCRETTREKVIKIEHRLNQISSNIDRIGK